MDNFVLGLLFRQAYEGRFAGEIERLRRAYPQVRIVLGHYEEPHALRTARAASHDPAALRAQAPVLDEAQRALFAQVDAVLALDLPFDVRRIAPKLKWVQAIGAGTSQLQSAGLADAGIRLTSNGGANAGSIAEFVVGRMLQVMKCFRELDAHQAEERWKPVFGEQFSGKTAGLLGLGAINSRVAALLKAFGMRVVATRRSGRHGDTAPDVELLYAPDELDLMLGECDAIVAAVPDTSDTAGLINGQRIAAMRKGAIFCNVGRGSLVDEAALADALRRAHLGAAILDVTNLEPLPAGHDLWKAPNLYLSAHCASTPDTLFLNVHRLLRENLGRFLRGEPLLSEVDLKIGY